MDYRKKLKTRLYTAIGYVIIGIALIVISLLKISENEIISSFGAALAICGIVRIVQYVKIIKDEDNIHKHEVAEKDERNIMLAEKAGSLTFRIYLMLAGTSMIVLYLLQKILMVQMIAYNICALVLIYQICYRIISKKY